MRETWVWSLGWEDPLEKGMATHSSILAWRIPWTEGPGRLQSMGSQSVRHNWPTFTSLHIQKLFSRQKYSHLNSCHLHYILYTNVRGLRNKFFEGTPNPTTSLINKNSPLEKKIANFKGKNCKQPKHTKTFLISLIIKDREKNQKCGFNETQSLSYVAKMLTNNVSCYFFGRQFAKNCHVLKYRLDISTSRILSYTRIWMSSQRHLSKDVHCSIVCN